MNKLSNQTIVYIKNKNIIKAQDDYFCLGL